MLPKGVHRVVARGREYFYFQAGRGSSFPGQRIALPKDPQSPEFWNALRSAQAPVVIEVITTVDVLCDLYETSPQFAALARSSRDQYLRALGYARRAWGTLPAAGLRPVHVRQLLDGLAERPGTANNVLGVLRALSAWGVERGHLEGSLTGDVKAYKSGGGHKPWSPEQCAAAERHFVGNIRRAYFLARYTGQRGSDVVELSPRHVEDGLFHLVQRKTKREVWLPIVPALAAEMGSWEKGLGPFVPLPKKTFEDHFAKARDAVPELRGATFHGLRGTRVIELRLEGRATAQIADIVGMSLSMIERYCRFADRKANAKAMVIDLSTRRKETMR